MKREAGNDLVEQEGEMAGDGTGERRVTDRKR